MLVGVLGGGQLGRMLALAGYPLGLRFRFLDTNPDAPAGQVAPLIAGKFDDEAALTALADGAAVVTSEFENVPAASAAFLARRWRVAPSVAALETGQDRLAEKTLFARAGIPTPAFAPAANAEEFRAAADMIGLPVVAKTRRLGYDGRGQAVITASDEIDPAWRGLALAGADRHGAIVEAYVPFERELSLIGVRARDGSASFYPLCENLHRGGMLRFTRVPARGVTIEIQRRAEDYSRRVMEALEYVGVLTIEFFLERAEDGGRLLGNETAPRVHNSGHWTIDAAHTSQFENHLRAICGWPLGDCRARAPFVAMANIIGAIPDPAAVLRVPGARLHLYGKAPRPGRKLGHVTVTADDAAELERRVAQLNA